MAWGTLSGNEQAFNNYFNKAKEAFEQTNMDVQHFLKNEWADYKMKVEAVKLDPFGE